MVWSYSKAWFIYWHGEKNLEKQKKGTLSTVQVSFIKEKETTVSEGLTRNNIIS